MDDRDAERSGDAGGGLAGGDKILALSMLEAHGYTAGRDRLAQAIDGAGIEALVGIELGMGNEAAGIIQDGMQKDLHLLPPPGRCRT